MADEGRFWALITECRHQGSDTDSVSRQLFRRLRVLDAADVVAFVEHWERTRSRLYSWPVADAACLLLGSVEEEDLRHIQDWVISHGQTTVDRVCRNSDDIADHQVVERHYPRLAAFRRSHPEIGQPELR